MLKSLSNRSLFKKSVIADPSKTVPSCDVKYRGLYCSENQWSDTLIVFLPFNQLVDAVNEFLANDVANIVAKYAVFPQWLLKYDLSSPHQQHLNARNKMSDCVNSSHIAIQEIVSSKIKNNILFENTIRFTDNTVTHTLRFIFHQHHIQHLAKANDQNEFSDVIEQMFTTCALNDHFMKINLSDQKQVNDKKKYLTRLYDSWIHSLGTKYVCDNLNELTKFIDNDQ